MSTILNVKRHLLQICTCIHGPRQRNSGLLPSAQLFTSDKEGYAPIKKDEPLFLSQIRTGITESNKTTYPFLLLQSYRHGVTVPNPVQEHNLNALFVSSSSDIMYDEQTFDDQVIEYFVILVREQDVVAYSGRENPRIQLHKRREKGKKKPYTKDVGERRQCYRALRLPLLRSLCHPR